MEKGMKHPLVLKLKVRKGGTLQHYWIDPDKRNKNNTLQKIPKDVENKYREHIDNFKKSLLIDSLIPPHYKIDEIYLKNKLKEAFNGSKQALDEIKNKLPKSPTDITDSSKIKLLSNNKQQTVKDKLVNNTAFKDILNKELQKIDTNKLKKLVNDTASSMKSIINKSHFYFNIPHLHRMSKEEYDMVKKKIQKSLDKYNKNIRRKNLFGSQVVDHIFSPDTVTSVGNIIRTYFRDSNFLNAMDHLCKISEKYPDSSCFENW